MIERTRSSKNIVPMSEIDNDDLILFTDFFSAICTDGLYEVRKGEFWRCYRWDEGLERKKEIMEMGRTKKYVETFEKCKSKAPMQTLDLTNPDQGMRQLLLTRKYSYRFPKYTLSGR